MENKMPNYTIKKSDKLVALEAMTKAKFKAKFDKLQSRRVALAMRVYQDTLGRIGEPLKDAAGDKWKLWLDTRCQFRLVVDDDDTYKGPRAPIDTGKKRYGNTLYACAFTGEKTAFSGDLNEQVRFPDSVVWPDNKFDNKLHVDNASANTRKVASTLARDIAAFNWEVDEFLDTAYGLLMSLRTSKQIDDRLPELWKYLPAGTREAMKQAVVPFTQQDYDQFRKQLPKG